MYLQDYLEKFKDKNIKMFIDMDGVIVDYIVGDYSNFADRRPLHSSINKLEEISKNDNIELFILSISRMDNGVSQKNTWLDKYANFIKKENRVIISRESNNFEKSSVLKANYLKNIERKENYCIILIDDDPVVLEKVKEENEDVIVLKDTALVD